jgi:hypothetical protein
MSPAGSTSEDPPEGFPNLRPVVTKTFVKGVIGLAVFSLLMQLSLANLVNYLIFLCLSFGLLAGYMFYKRGSTFEVGDDAIVVRRPAGFPASLLRRHSSPRELTVSYDDIADVSVAQGILAKRFHCGSIYLILKHGEGSMRLMGGGTAERLHDIPNPNFVCRYMIDRLSPYAPA